MARETMSRVCDVCGKQFLTYTPTRHYCSVECSTAAAKAARAKIDHAKYLRRKERLKAAKRKEDNHG